MNVRFAVFSLAVSVLGVLASSGQTQKASDSWQTFTKETDDCGVTRWTFQVSSADLQGKRRDEVLWLPLGRFWQATNHRVEVSTKGWNAHSTLTAEFGSAYNYRFTAYELHTSTEDLPLELYIHPSGDSNYYVFLKTRNDFYPGGLPLTWTVSFTNTDARMAFQGDRAVAGDTFEGYDLKWTDITPQTPNQSLLKPLPAPRFSSEGTVSTRNFQNQIDSGKIKLNASSIELNGAVSLSEPQGDISMGIFAPGE